MVSQYWWVGHLRKKEYNVARDRETFSSWENGTIDTEQCISEFRENNMLNPNKEIPIADMEQWLNGLGYKKGA